MLTMREMHKRWHDSKGVTFGSLCRVRRGDQPLQGEEGLVQVALPGFEVSH